MQLEEFISGTLTQIARGIERANEGLRDCDARVNPPNVAPGSTNFNQSIYGYLGHKPQMPAVHLIQFDVAVFAAEGTESRGGIGIMVGTIALGSQGKSADSQSTTSRIQFGIPMLLPRSEPVAKRPGD